MQLSKIVDLEQKGLLRNRTGRDLMGIQCGDSLLIEVRGRKVIGPDYIDKQIRKDFAKSLNQVCFKMHIFKEFWVFIIIHFCMKPIGH